ncbi:MAG: acetyl-CoA hydrolase/transferase family protein [Actinobacteria bacterium]|nr:acetyl-CoA hydrolase/transferase family protein [Actinomycetota bacterium]
MVCQTPVVPPALPPSQTVEALVDLVTPGTDVIVPLGNGEPVAFLDALEERADSLEGVRIHQMHPLRHRAHHTGRYGDRLRHVSYFLSPEIREDFRSGHLDLIPNDFHRVPALLQRRCRKPLVVVASSPPDHLGIVSMGVTADYAAALLDRFPVAVEVNPAMPRTGGRHQVSLSDAVGWTTAATDLVEVQLREPDDVDRSIAGFVAERIPNGATVQIGLGSVPSAVVDLLGDHRDLRIHTELFGDALMGLVESGAVRLTDASNEPAVVTTTAFGTRALYQWLGEEDLVSFRSVEVTNSPRVIGDLPQVCAINATMQVDLLGQCASESLGHHYVSSSGGQADFLRGAQLADDGQSFIVTRSTALDGTVSRIVADLAPGSVVTGHKNLVDKVVTEYGVAELEGRTVAERAEALIAIADPRFSDDLERASRQLAGH